MDPILDLSKRKTYKSVKETVDLTCKLPETMFLQEMSITLIVIGLYNF